MLKGFLFFIVFLGIAVTEVYFIWDKEKTENKADVLILDTTLQETASPNSASHNSQESQGFKMFKFDNFHGSTDISDKFQFQYPASWHNEGQYFSPQKIQYYTKYEVKAPIWFDLVLAEIFNFTELNYQIDTSKRRNPDTTGRIDGREFKKYDLTDYGTYGGDSAGRVKVFVGPKIKIDGQDYYLVFHWEERPLTENMPGNSIDVFDNMLLSLKFF